jgi:ABC-type uncharacterized transport system permease subunit
LLPIAKTQQLDMIAPMLPGVLHSLTALICLVPAVLLRFRPQQSRDWAFWGAVVLAFAGPGVLSLALLWGHWVTGLAPALWVSLTVTVVAFAVVSVVLSSAWRLLPLLSPYLLLVGVIATIWQQAMGHTLLQAEPTTWLGLHIVLGVATYALLTLAAVASLAAFVQERALKRKRPTHLSAQLPSVTDAERQATILLAVSEAVLGVGLGSGMAVEWIDNGQLLTWDHKTLLSILAFVLIGLLLYAIRFCGVRGRLAARIILLAWLLVTLAYPGVKFVTGVLIG